MTRCMFRLRSSVSYQQLWSKFGYHVDAVRGIGVKTFRKRIGNKKLIRRWDSERELSSRRHRIHAVQNTIDSCINFATDRRDYVLEHRFTKFSEITQCNGHYAVQGHSRSPILVPIKSSYTTSYYWLILTYLLSYTVFKLWLIIGQICERGVPHFNAVTGGDLLPISP